MTEERQGPPRPEEFENRQFERDLRAFQRQEREREEVKLQKIREWLKVGGEVRFRRGAAAEIFDVAGPDRVRQTGAGYTTIVPPLLDPRLKLTPEQRAAGATYAAYVEDMLGGGGSEWLREFVDGGSHGSGGQEENRFHRMRLVKVAREAIQRQKLLRYPLGKKRGKAKRGPHKPIPPLELLDMVTIQSRSVTFVGVSYGWTTERRGKMEVPDRQRKWIRMALAINLDLIRDKWSDNKLNPPGGMSSIDVE